MLELWETLPFAATTTIVVAISLVLVFAISRFLRNRWLWLPALLIPLAVSYCLYWIPVWRGADSSEYSAWAVLVLGNWFVFAVTACCVLVSIVLRRPTN